MNCNTKLPAYAWMIPEGKNFDDIRPWTIKEETEADEKMTSSQNKSI